MTEIIKALFEIVVWTFVPGTAAVVLYKMYQIPKDEEKDPRQLSLRAGFWGGVILFLIIFVAQTGRFVQTAFPQETIYQGFNSFLALGSAIVVFAAYYRRHEIRHGSRAWLALGLSSLSLWVFFHYLFIHTANKYILSLTLGALFGLFVYKVFVPVREPS